MPAALAAARDLASIPPAVFRVTKQQMRMPALAQMDAADAELGQEIDRLWTEASTFDTVRAYVERTLKRSVPGARP